MRNTKKTYICNCKSENITDYHETLVYGDQQCYYCGYYAQELPAKVKVKQEKSNTRKQMFKTVKEIKHFRQKVKKLRESGEKMAQIAYRFNMSLAMLENVYYLINTYKKYKGKV